MKKIAIFKIISFSVIAIALVVILVCGITKKSSGFSLNYSGFHYSNSKAYEIMRDEMSMDVNGINKLEVHWMGGSVNVTRSDDDKIHFFEICDDGIRENEDNLMRYLVKDNKLTIQFCKSRWFVKNKVQRGKELVIKLPTEMVSEVDVASISANIAYKDVDLVTTSYLKIDTVSGNIEISNTNLNTLKIESVSGKINLNSVDCKQEISIDTVSGNINSNNTHTNYFDVDVVSADIRITGDINIIDIDNVSGNVRLELNNVPTKIDSDSVSGDITILIPDNEGFKVKLDSVSGELSTNFASVISKKELIYKNGSAYYKFESVSGDVRIEMNGLADE